jgi:hypothetical protein
MPSFKHSVLKKKLHSKLKAMTPFNFMQTYGSTLMWCKNVLTGALIGKVVFHSTSLLVRDKQLPFNDL